MRLVNGDGFYEGRVEVYHDGQWGTVCEDQWDENDAAVVCSSLGLVGGVPMKYRWFGAGSGPIWMDDVNCTGSEASLKACSHRGWGVHNCRRYNKDAGVRCGKNTISKW